MTEAGSVQPTSDEAFHMFSLAFLYFTCRKMFRVVFEVFCRGEFSVTVKPKHRSLCEERCSRTVLTGPTLYDPAGKPSLLSSMIHSRSAPEALSVDLVLCANQQFTAFVNIAHYICRSQSAACLCDFL